LRDDIILWAVDTQADFMLPGGKLYVPGAERLLPNIRRLTEVARRGHVLLVSHGCIHTAEDPEFASFPPHCIEGTEGAKFVPEALTEKVAVVPNNAAASLPDDFSKYHQVHLHKHTLDIFESRHAESLVNRLSRHAEIFVFGVVTEYCVRFAAKGLLERGRKVSVITDAIETLNPAESQKTLAELQSLGARLVTTDDVLERLAQHAA
jgi:nicotinamidase/pyrazinamidase